MREFAVSDLYFATVYGLRAELGGCKIPKFFWGGCPQTPLKASALCAEVRTNVVCPCCALATAMSWLRHWTKGRSSLALCSCSSAITEHHNSASEKTVRTTPVLRLSSLDSAAQRPTLSIICGLGTRPKSVSHAYSYTAKFSDAHICKVSFSLHR